MRRFTRTVKAVGKAEFSLWGVVDALVKDIGKTENGGAKNGEYDACREALIENGYRGWSVTRLQTLHSLGTWVNPVARRQDFRQYPVEWVLEARRKAKSDHDKALDILAEAGSKRDIRPDKNHVGAGEIADALNDDDIRGDYTASDEGVVQVTQMSREIATKRKKRKKDIDVPQPPVNTLFWGSVTHIDGLAEAVETYGLRDLPLDPEAHEAAMRMHRLTGEILAAFTEASVEARMNEEV